MGYIWSNFIRDVTNRPQTPKSLRWNGTPDFREIHHGEIVLYNLARYVCHDVCTCVCVCLSLISVFCILLLGWKEYWLLCLVWKGWLLDWFSFPNLGSLKIRRRIRKDGGTRESDRPTPVSQMSTAGFDGRGRRTAANGCCAFWLTSWWKCWRKIGRGLHQKRRIDGNTKKNASCERFKMMAGYHDNFLRMSCLKKGKKQVAKKQCIEMSILLMVQKSQTTTWHV